MSYFKEGDEFYSLNVMFRRCKVLQNFDNNPLYVVHLDTGFKFQEEGFKYKDIEKICEYIRSLKIIIENKDE